MSALICGLFSYDTVMVFNDKFKHHITPSQMQALDVHFMVPDLRRQFGGGAGNIAYGLKLLGTDPVPMASVGTDFAPYAEWLASHEINCDHIKNIEHSYTAQTFVTIDMDDNHITAFHPGATLFSSQNHVSQANDISVGTISADSADGMMVHALQFSEAGIPFIFNPGHSIHYFDGDELLKFIEHASWILVTEKEWRIMSERTGLNSQQIARRVNALIVTRAEGTIILVQDTRYQIPVAHAKAMNDPSGCGDAFCAGLLYGLQKDIDWETTGRIASLMAAIKMEHHGTQNHNFSLDNFKIRFKKNFGYALLM